MHSSFKAKIMLIIGILKGSLYKSSESEFQIRNLII